MSAALQVAAVVAVVGLVLLAVVLWCLESRYHRKPPPE
jgi:hypothetical protein